MRRNPSRPVPEQVLSILEAHAGRAQASSERMLQIMDPYLFQVRFVPGPHPCGIQHPRDRLAPVAEDMRRVFPPLPFHDRGGDPVQYHQPVIGVFHIPARYDENRCMKRGNLHFPFPLHAADFTVTAAGIGGEQSHFREMRRQRLKRVFNIDIETCRECDGAMKVIACIEDTVVIRKILTCLADKALSAKPVPFPESRAPPQSRLFE